MIVLRYSRRIHANATKPNGEFGKAEVWLDFELGEYSPVSYVQICGWQGFLTG